MIGKRIVIALASLGAMSGCAHSVHQVYVSAMDARASDKADWRLAVAEQFVVLGFEFNSNYVEDAYRKLEGDCKGRIAQVSTEHLTSYKFLSYTQKVVLKGLCAKA